MILFKCKCGCTFTVKDPFFHGKGYKKLSCQNCGASFRVSDEDDLNKLYSLFADTGFSVSIIPDDSQINIRCSF